MALLWSQGQLLADSTDSHPGFGLHRTEEGKVGSRGPPVMEGGGQGWEARPGCVLGGLRVTCHFEDSKWSNQRPCASETVKAFVVDRRYE